MRRFPEIKSKTTLQDRPDENHPDVGSRPPFVLWNLTDIAHCLHYRHGVCPPLCWNTGEKAFWLQSTTPLRLPFIKTLLSAGDSSMVLPPLESGHRRILNFWVECHKSILLKSSGDFQGALYVIRGVLIEQTSQWILSSDTGLLAQGHTFRTRNYGLW